MSASPRRSFPAAWLALCALALLALAARPSAAAGRGAILLLTHGGGDAGSESALLDALRVSTRDLGCKVLAGRAPPPEPSPVEVGRADARGRAAGATMVVWIGRVDDKPVLYALRVAGGPLHRTPLVSRAGDAPALVARTLALKVRALYSRPPSERNAEWTQVPVAVGPQVKTGLDDEAQHAPPSPAPSTPAPPSVAAPRPPTVAAPPLAASPTSPSSGGGTSVSSRPAPPAGPRSWGLELGAAGIVDVGDPTWLRVGGCFRLALLTPRVPLAIQLDGAATSHPSVQMTAERRVELWEVPIGLALLYRLDWGRWGLSAGPRVSLHLERASATTSRGRVGEKLEVAAGLGAVLQGRVVLYGPLSLVVGVGGEALVPNQKFLTRDEIAADLGAGQFSVWVGAVVRVL